MVPVIDPELVGLPLAALADAAISAGRAAGASHVDIRVERRCGQDLGLRDGAVERATEDVEAGLAVRVLHRGSWGFASASHLTVDAAATLARRAVTVAEMAAPLSAAAVDLAGEPVHADAVWTSDYIVDPWDVTFAEKLAVLADWSSQLQAAAGVSHVDASVAQVREAKYYADSAGTSTLQQRVRVHPQVTVVRVDADGTFEALRSTALPVGRGWEAVTEASGITAELATLPELLAEKAAAPSVEPGRYDLVIDPTNLWLTIHESIGHATELDRALGYEAAYAGTSFATLDQLGTLRYGSPLLQVTGDRTAAHGLATVGFDDEGVAAQQFDLIRDGVLVGYQLDRAMTAAQTARLGLGRSNGCAYADGPHRSPLQRMPNVSMQPVDGGADTAALIAGVERGIYVVGDRSWSIDMQRHNFQFTGQRFYAIRSGRLAGPLRDVAYQASTTQFWGALAAVGGPQTYLLGGALNCGKGQPAQTAPVSHGCPSAVFQDVAVLNTRREGGRG